MCILFLRGPTRKEGPWHIRRISVHELVVVGYVIPALWASPLAVLLPLLLSACGGSSGSDSASPPPLGDPIYTSSNLAGHEVAAECNPGGATECSCSNSDVVIASSLEYGEVTSNIARRNTYVNAIGYKKFEETFPDGNPLRLGVYRYRGELRLPVVPRPDANQIANPQAVHMMIQLWDGRESLFQSARATLEGAIYYDLNPWGVDFGKIKIYTEPVQLIDTGVSLVPDDAWHTFELVVDLSQRTYVRVTIDNETRELSGIPLARVPQPTWGHEVALNITTESLAAWPQASCDLVFTWTTYFRNLRFGLLAAS